MLQCHFHLKFLTRVAVSASFLLDYSTITTTASSFNHLTRNTQCLLDHKRVTFTERSPLLLEDAMKIPPPTSWEGPQVSRPLPKKTHRFAERPRAPRGRQRAMVTATGRSILPRPPTRGL